MSSPPKSPLTGSENLSSAAEPFSSPQVSSADGGYELRPPFGQQPIVDEPGPGSELPWPKSRGVLHIVLGVVFVLAGSIAGLTLGGILAGSEAIELYRETDELPLAMQASSLLGLQVAMFVWPFLVSRLWGGRGAAQDWGVKFKAADVGIGLALAIGLVFSAAVTAAIMTRVVGLADQSEAGNTQFLEDAQGSPWLYVLIFGAVVGAPVSEEIFFRGLVMRSFERFGGRIIGVLGSTVLFALPHFVGAGWQGTVVLLTSISVVGALLGIVAAITRRLGPSIVAHLLFNAFAVSTVLM